jgi:hypothetical protein
MWFRVYGRGEGFRVKNILFLKKQIMFQFFVNSFVEGVLEGLWNRQTKVG